MLPLHPYPGRPSFLLPPPAAGPTRPCLLSLRLLFPVGSRLLLLLLLLLLLGCNGLLLLVLLQPDLPVHSGRSKAEHCLPCVTSKNRLLVAVA